ncbi:hypothetical protein [Jeotgalibacillus soli]|uniref:Uncharacterized protein n=1 Tax=Jeotgalibacillus soli TaxID=889306 RepID=A0A0C2VLM7_9BACL|nr:hypothetical protein [Jeotgalibacillus soli]KIL49832.1 hypothetical protein KP78_13000 [Jeotgalibacillus soli]
MSEVELSLSVRYKDFEYTVKGDQTLLDRHEPIALNLLNQVIDLEKQQPSKFLPKKLQTSITPTRSLADEKVPESAAHSVSASDKKEIQLFLEGLPLQSEWQYTLAIAYYITQHHGHPAFTAKAVRKQFRESRHNVPNNIHLSVHTCVKKGFLIESGLSDLQKTYEITSTGIQYISDLKIPNDSISSETALSFDPSSGPSEKQLQLLDITIQDLNLNNNPNPILMERIDDQALSILYIYRNELDYPCLSAQDVYYILRDVFSYNHSSKAVQIALSRSRPKVEKIKKDGQIHYQLTQVGIEYLEQRLNQQLPINE